MHPFDADLRERFFSKITAGPGECIDWVGARRPSGYGLLSVDGKPMNATHVSWRLKHGDWPGRKVLHRCDRPVCVNPEHLFEGSDADNAAGRAAKGRGAQVLTGLEVSEIIALAETAMPLPEIAALFGITAGYVSNLRHGRYRSDGRHAVVGTKPFGKRTIVHGEELTLRQIAERYNQPLARVRQRYSRGARGDALIRAEHARS